MHHPCSYSCEARLLSCILENVLVLTISTKREYELYIVAARRSVQSVLFGVFDELVCGQIASMPENVTLFFSADLL